MQRYLLLLFTFIIYSSAFGKSIDTLWERTLPPKDITLISCSKDCSYLYHFNDYHFLFKKVGNKYIHYKLPDMAPFYKFTFDDKLIGYKKKDTITIYDCKTKNLKIYDVTFLHSYTFWEMVYITSKTFAIIDPTNAGKLRIYDLETNKLIYELGDYNSMPVKTAFLSNDESFLLCTMDGPKLAKFDLINKITQFKTYINDWQEPDYKAIFANDSIAIIYCDYFKDFMTVNTNRGKIILEDTCDYFYRLSSFSQVSGDNHFIMHNIWDSPYDIKAKRHLLINWLSGEKQTFDYNDFFSITINQSDTILLRKDFDNKERCVIYFHNLYTGIRDTIYNEYIIDTLFNKGTNMQIFEKSNIMCSRYTDSTYIYSLNKGEKIGLFEVPDVHYRYISQYDEKSFTLQTEKTDSTLTYKLYNYNTRQFEREFIVNSNSLLNFFKNKQYGILYSNGNGYRTLIYDFIHNSTIYNSTYFMDFTANGAFIENDTKSIGNNLYQHSFTYIPEADTNKKQSFEYTFYADKSSTAYSKSVTVDVSIDRKKLIYPNYNNYIIKVNLENNIVDSCLIDITPISLFFSKDGKYFQVRDSNNFKIYNYLTNELAISYSKTRDYKELTNDYMNYIILYSDTLRKMYCVRFNLDNLRIENEIQSNDQAKFSLYPNPANNIINIYSKSKNLINCIEVYNLRAEQISKINNIYSQIYALDINNYPTGVYYIKIDGVTNIFVKE
jgi:hypothetical protein